MEKYRNELSELAGRIQWIIDENGLKQVEFARTLGISANYVYLLTSGKKKNLSDSLTKLIEATYGVPAEWITTGKTQISNLYTNDLRVQTIQKLKEMDIQSLRSVANFIRTIEKDENESGE